MKFLSQNRPGPRMGMGHYERLLIHHLIQNTLREEWSFDITFDGRSAGQTLEPEQVEPGLSSAAFQGFSMGRLTNSSWALTRMVSRVVAGSYQPDIYHSLALSYPAPSGGPVIFTIHDLPPARFPDEGKLPKWSKQAVEAASAVVTPSQFAKNELMELLCLPEERIHVIPNGCEHDVFHSGVSPADAETLAALGLGQPYLLYVGGTTRRKNVSALLEAWRMVSAQYPGLTLALAGPTGALEALASESRAQNVVVLGYITRDRLPSLLKAAVALVCPSVYEGFGLPPLEAMAMGTPVVAVCAGAIPEVVGDCAVLAPDGSPESLAGAILSLLGDSSRAEVLSENGPARASQFQWSEHAKSVLDIYQKVSRD